MPPNPSADHRSVGRIVVICGCMFSGKTARLIERLEAARGAGRRVIALKHRLDDRYDELHLYTHDGRSFAAQPASDVAQIAALVGDAEVIGLDEAQFFGRELVPLCRTLRERGRTLIVAGIDHDAWGQPFPPLPELKEIADEVELRHMPCVVCGRPARYSQRMVPVQAGQMVGGPEEYQPRCAACFEPLPAPAPVY